VVAQAISDAVRDFSDDLPQIVDRVRHSELGELINGGSSALDTLREHVGDITRGVGKVSGGIAGLIIGLVALSVSLDALIAFAIVIVVYQQIENYVLQPTIIGKTAQVSGFTVLASVLALGALFGLIGAIIAVPIAVGLQIVIEELTAARRARIAAADAAERRHDHREASRAPARDASSMAASPDRWR
jgi:hypothetical protein